MLKQKANFCFNLILAISLIVQNLIFVVPRVEAANGVPRILSYQGRLADSSGTLLGSSSGTTFYFKFSIWDNATVGSGTQLWPASAPTSVSANVISGVFNVNIGDTANGYPTPLDLNFNNNQDIFLEVKASSDNSSFETLSPRQRIAASAFSELSAAVSGTTTPSSFGTTTPIGSSQVSIEATSSAATGLTVRASSGQVADLFRIQNASGSNLVFTNASGGLFASSTLQVTGATVFYGTVGVGTTTPSATFAVQGNSLFSGDVAVASLTASGTTKLNGVTYTWPSSVTNGNFLQTDASGNLTWAAASGGSGWTSSGSLIYTTTVTDKVLVGTTTAATYKFAVYGGDVAFQNSTNSTTAFQVQNAATSTVFVVDTSNRRVGVSTSTPGDTLSVQGNLLVSNNINVASLTATGTVTTANLLTSASSSLQNFTFLFATGTAATTTTLSVSLASTTGLYVSSGATTTNLTVTGSTRLGVVSQGVWQGTAVAPQFGGTGSDLSAATGVLVITSGANATASSTLAASIGGTGLTSYTTGDLLYASALNVFSKLGVGSSGQVLTVTNGIPAWVATTSPTGTGTANLVARFTGTSALGTGILSDTGTVSGVSSTTPWGQFSIDAAQGTVGTGTPIFVIGDTGTSSPFLYVSGVAGQIGIGTTSPSARFALQGDELISGTSNVASLTATGTVTTANLLASASSSLQNFTFLFATGTAATTTYFYADRQLTVGGGAELDITSSSSVRALTIGTKDAPATLGGNSSNVTLKVGAAANGDSTPIAGGTSGILTIQGGVGGAGGQPENGPNDGRNGGAGGALQLTAGAGGNGSNAFTTGTGGTGGVGGSFTLTAGNAGNAGSQAGGTAVAVNGVAGGSFTFTTGNGGASGSFTTAVGGDAGTVTFALGSGGSGQARAGVPGAVNVKAASGQSTAILKLQDSLGAEIFSFVGNSASSTSVRMNFAGFATTTIPVGRNAWSIATTTTSIPIFSVDSFSAFGGAIGISSTSPNAKLAISSAVGNAALYIDQSSSTPGSALFYVTSTTTGGMDWARVAVGTTTTFGTAAGLRDQFTVAGRIYSTWRYASCDLAGMSLPTTVSADRESVCGQFNFDVAANTSLSAQVQGNPTYLNLVVTAAAGNGGAIKSFTNMTAASSSPVLETWVRDRANGSSTETMIGFIATSSLTTTISNTSGPQNGIYFEASSTLGSTGLGDWYAVTSSGGTQTFVDTGIASSTTSLNPFANPFMKMRVEAYPYAAAFFINGTQVAYITTNIPVHTMSPMVSIGIANRTGVSSVAGNLDISLLRLWVDDPPDDGGGAVVAGTGDSTTATRQFSTDYNAGSNYGIWYEAGPTSQEIVPGMVMALDPDSLEAVHIVPATQGNEENTVGVVTASFRDTLGENTGQTPIAFVGRVNVLVNGRGGKIKLGDYLTISPEPGVAMKATKAGAVIGQALGSFSGQATGTIPMIVRNSHFNGQRFSDLVAGLDNPIGQPLDKFLLAQFIHQNAAPIASTTVSDILADRIGAALEVISPKVLTKDLTVDTIQPLENDVTLTLGDHGTFVIKRQVTTTTQSASGTSTSTESVITFDASGNAVFVGQITADKINANQISGLEVITNTLTLLSGQIQNLSSQENASLVNLTVSGGLTVSGTTTFSGTTSFASSTEFLSGVHFADDVEVSSRAFFRGAVDFTASTTFEDNVNVIKNLSVGGGFTIQNASNTAAIVTIDNQGNAAFGGAVNAARLIVAGKVTVGDITAGEIESPTITGIQDTLAAFASTTSNLSVSIDDLKSRVARLEAQGGVDLSQALHLNGALTVQGQTTLTGGLKVDSIGSIGNELVFLNDVVFGRPYFNADTGGFALVHAGDRTVDVVFDREYAAQPVVNASISIEDTTDATARQVLEDSIFTNDIRFLITKKSTRGFTILLNKLAGQDIYFSWIALAIKDARTVGSVAPPSPVPSPAPSPSQIPDASSTPLSGVGSTASDTPVSNSFSSPPEVVPTEPKLIKSEPASTPETIISPPTELPPAESLTPTLATNENNVSNPSSETIPISP